MVTLTPGNSGCGVLPVCSTEGLESTIRLAMGVGRDHVGPQGVSVIACFDCYRKACGI